jgi:TolA-binding protein
LKVFRSPTAALAAATLALGCAGQAGAIRSDVDALRAEVRALRHENAQLSRAVESLSVRLEAMAARRAKAPAEADRSPSATLEAIVPRDLAVVKVAPAARPARSAPPLANAVPIGEPDPDRLDRLSRPGGRDIAAEAEGELRAARRQSGIERAHALEDFAARYPRHPSADNALVDAGRAYADGGQDTAGCSLARRAANDYPAGDAMSDALEMLAACASRLGEADAERALLERLVSEYPRTPAADRAGRRLAAISGSAGEEKPADGPGRSTP